MKNEQKQAAWKQYRDQCDAANIRISSLTAREIFQSGLEANAWVSVEDGLPEVGGEYDVTVPELGGEMAVMTDYFLVPGRQWSRYQGHIAWRERPAPFTAPSGQGENNLTST